MTRWLALTATALILSASAARAQEPIAEPTDPVDLGDVVVEGRRLSDLTRDFVAEVGAPPYRRGLARWREGLCVGAVNLQPAAAQPLIDHISRVAMSVGLRPRDPGCRPNVLIVFSDDAAALSREMVEAGVRFRSGVGGLDRGRTALEDFVETDRPVRWWHTSVPINAETGGPGVRLPGMTSAPFVRGEGLINKGRNVRDDLNRVIIIVDVDAVSEVPTEQLADYLALVSLVQVDPDGDTTRFQTILNLFDNPGDARGLTGWDHAYLDALYGAPSWRVRDSDQWRQVLRNLRRDRAAEAAAEEG